MSARVRRTGSKSVKNLLRVLPRFTRGDIAAETAADLAPSIQRAMRSQLKPHRRTGDAETRAIATANGSIITLFNAGYAKFIDGYFFARRFPKDWVKRVQRAFKGKIRAELRRSN